MDKIYTIGFTKKSAEEFFCLLKANDVKIVLDIRLNNTSQLAAFSKYPDIEYFLRELCNIKYKHDKQFSPTTETLKSYKNKKISWEEYTDQFYKTMNERNIGKYIENNYSTYEGICLLCSEQIPEKCHRKLVAERFAKILGNKIIHLI